MPISPVSQKVKGFYSLCEMLVDILYSYMCLNKEMKLMEYAEVFAYILSYKSAVVY